ncbi:MAG: nucleotide pyrophosphohydrolase [Blastopirellula sp. JB062]
MADDSSSLDALIDQLSTDDQTSVAAIKRMISQFVAERDWRQFHAPKNISMALAVEAAELMEHFQWLSVDASRAVTADQAKMTAIGEELADILCYGLALANELNIDVAAAMSDKMRKNVRKYPKDEFQGRFGKEDRGPQA